MEEGFHELNLLGIYHLSWSGRADAAIEQEDRALMRQTVPIGAEKFVFGSRSVRFARFWVNKVSRGGSHALPQQANNNICILRSQQVGVDHDLGLRPSTGWHPILISVADELIADEILERVIKLRNCFLDHPSFDGKITGTRKEDPDRQDGGWV
jgi:hypothetical protein